MVPGYIAAMRALLVLAVMTLVLGACGGSLPPPKNAGTYKCPSYNTNEKCHLL
jgi:hypothetical protein